MNQLETDLGVLLLHRSPTGVTLTTAGAALLDEARTIGLQGDVTDRGPTRLAASYRRQHPGVEVRIGEADLTDPTCAATCRLRAAGCGLRAGLVYVALTRPPFDETGLTLADLADLADRRWFQFPDGTDPLWQSYGNGDEPCEGAVVRGVQERLQAVLWNGTVGMTPLGHRPPEELAVVPVTDMGPSHVVAAWNTGGPEPADPLVRPDRDGRLLPLSTRPAGFAPVRKPRPTAPFTSRPKPTPPGDDDGLDAVAQAESRQDPRHVRLDDLGRDERGRSISTFESPSPIRARTSGWRRVRARRKSPWPAGKRRRGAGLRRSGR
ncbi:hypothetical protein ACFY0G_39135 [Streptomyces sp. NPDC001552]|uniref:hypothetical protein n=1 Tax=Streptomyces sp. NPDC001552 TaxID=3364587 RepID=UPI0036A84067